MIFGRPSLWYSLLGLGFAVAGIDKLFGLRSYERLFRHWGWSKGAMQWVGAGELAGGLLVADGRTRRLGGAVLAATSASVLGAEIQHGDRGLALPRLALLGAAVLALSAPRG